MNVSLILYAEHEFNASTFTARVGARPCPTCTCVTGAIGSLRGLLHGRRQRGGDGTDRTLLFAVKPPPSC